MSKPRISDEDLAAAEKFHSAEDHNVYWMARELRERRAQDISTEDLAALAHASVIVNAADCGDVADEPLRARALVVLAKLLESR